MENRQTYLEAVKKQLEQNIFFHSLAVEVCMAGIFDYLWARGQLPPDEAPREDWCLAGLIHDIDYGGDFKEQHPLKTREALRAYGLDISDTVHHIIQAHAPELTCRTPGTKAEWAIYCSDSLTGLIMAVALIYPSKKLAEVKVSSVVKRFLKQPKFAAGTRRIEVAECSKPEGLHIPIEKFIEICLVSMQKIADQIGL